MKAREFQPERLDVEAFAKAEATLEGEWPLASLVRLFDCSLRGDAPEAAVRWSLRGERRQPRGGEPQVWLHVEAATRVHLECQRCLGSVEEPLSVRRSFLFVADEAAAEALDAESEDDVLALTRVLDARGLIEDELLLALPLVPRHESCPQPLVAPVDELPEDSEAPHPFAALAALKRGGLPN